MPNGIKENILNITKRDQCRTVDDLFKRCQPDSVYYTLLILSIFIISAGLLLENSPIVIGGMLVTPVLTPILALSLGISVGDTKSIQNTGFLILKSTLIVIAASFALTLFFGAPENNIVFENSMKTAILYFIVAVTSGVAATFAIAKKEISEVLPGISIAVSLVPPLSLIGIWLGAGNLEITRFYLLVFIFNLFGVLMGSLIVFSLLKFHKTEKQVQEKNHDGEEAAESD